MSHCSIDGCNQRHEAKGYCVKHYTRLIRYGDPAFRVVRRGDAQEFFEGLLTHRDDRTCVPWPFTTSGSDKRPWMKRKGVRGFVARFLCAEAHGGEPGPQFQVAHSCGNKDCVNPTHLRWDTPKGNAADKIAHGTTSRGERHGAAKLTAEQVREIRGLEGKMPKTEIGRRYGINSMHVLRLMRRERWAHID